MPHSDMWVNMNKARVAEAVRGKIKLLRIDRSEYPSPPIGGWRIGKEMLVEESLSLDYYRFIAVITHWDN